MPRFVEIVVGLLAASIAGVAVFLLMLIVTGVGPSWPRLPMQTTATVLWTDRQLVGMEVPRFQYFAMVRWTNEHGVVRQQRDAWDKSQADLSEGATVPAVIFQPTGDQKTRSSNTRIGLGSLSDYWRKQGLWDWGAFWGPILAIGPAIWLAYSLLRSPKALRSGHTPKPCRQ